MTVLGVISALLMGTAGGVLISGHFLKKKFPSLAKAIHNCEYRKELEKTDKILIEIVKEAGK